ncbi:MAG: hypothetical protein HY819_08145 [Acidobacteria bacterium]|nr:hypothetical protein [Acidobacteriota bacterium]
MRKWINLLLVLIVAGFFSLLPVANAASIVKISDKNLVLSSDVIVTGKVIAIESQWDENRKNIYTNITLSLDQVIKGDIKSQVLVIEQLGGQVANKQVWLSASPEFSLNEEVLLFLKANEEGVLHTSHLAMGKFSISKENGKENARVSNPIFGKSKTYDIEEYLSNIRKLVVSNEQKSVNNLQVIPSKYVPGTGEQLSNFKLSTARFFNPDSGGMVNFVVNSTASPVSGGANTEVNNAMMAWNRSGSTLKLANGGASSICGAKTDQQSVISFSGCNKDMMDPPMEGQGVISTVMVVVNTMDFRIINGAKFNQITEADIVYNNAFNNVLSASKDLEEIITHDLGIAFGLDNSSTDPNELDATLRESIMYFQPHLDKRGARLNTDDQMAVNRIYPFITPIQVTATTLPVGVFNSAYTAQISASGGTPPFTFAVTKGQVPTGLELNRFGIIAGIPTKIESQTFDVTVTDQANFRATRTFQLNTTSLPPRLSSIDTPRVSYNSNSMVTITGFNFSTVTDVRVTQGRLLAFRATNDNTLVIGLAGPGTTGVLTDITVVNPGGMITMPSAILYDGPAIRSAQAAKVRVRNMKGKFVNQKAIIIKGDGLTLNQQIRVNGTAVNLKPARSDNDDIVYFGVLKSAIPIRGDFNVTIFDPGLNSESNSVKGKRLNE